MTNREWDMVILITISGLVIGPLLWIYAKANRIQRDAAFKQMRESWRRMWDRLGRLEARDKPRKGAKRR